MKKLMLHYLLLFLICISCKQTDIKPVLTQAENLMETKSDSSLLLLESIEHPEKMSKLDYATWCLLVTQARDKNYVEHTSDSLITIATTYFEGKNNQERKVKAYYYKGRVNEDLGHLKEALLFYLKARDNLTDISNNHLKALVYTYIGDIQWKLLNNEDAKNSYKDAYTAFRSNQDTVNCGYIVRNIGRVFTATKQSDSAKIYLIKALDLAILSGQMSLQSNVENDLAVLFNEKGDCQKALEYGRTSLKHITNPKNLPSSYLLLGSLFNKTE